MNKEALKKIRFELNPELKKKGDNINSLIKELEGVNNRKLEEFTKEHSSAREVLSKKFTDSKSELEKEIKTIRSLLEKDTNLSKSEISSLNSRLKKTEDSIKIIYSSFYRLDNAEGRIKILGSSFDKFKEDSGARQDVFNSSIKEFEENIAKAINYFSEKVSSIEKEEFSSKLKVIESDVESFKKIDHNLKFKELDDKFGLVDEILNKLSKGIYEYGASLNVSINGISIGTANNIDFVNGTDTTISYTTDNLGVHIKVNSKSQAVGIPVYGEIPTGSGVTFTLLHTPLNGVIALYRGGARQQSGVLNDYTVSGNTITLSASLSVGEVILCDYLY